MSDITIVISELSALFKFFNLLNKKHYAGRLNIIFLKKYNKKLTKNQLWISKKYSFRQLSNEKNICVIFLMKNSEKFLIKKFTFLVDIILATVYI